MGEIAIGAEIMKVLGSKWLWAIVAALGLAAGVYFYLQHDKKDAVNAAVNAADATATAQSLGADQTARDRIDQQDTRYVVLHDQTIKDYSNARSTLQSAPQVDRDAVAPRLLVDTLNQLDRMRRNRDAGEAGNAAPDASGPDVSGSADRPASANRH